MTGFLWSRVRKCAIGSQQWQVLGVGTASSQKDPGYLQAKSRGENLPRIGGGMGSRAGRKELV